MPTLKHTKDTLFADGHSVRRSIDGTTYAVADTPDIARSIAAGPALLEALIESLRETNASFQACMLIVKDDEARRLGMKIVKTNRELLEKVSA